MRVTNGQIRKIPPSRRLGPEHPGPDGSAGSSPREPASTRLPVVSAAASAKTPDRSVKVSRSAAFLTQLLAQTDARQSDARLARRFPEEPLKRYAQAAALKKSARTELCPRMRPVTV